ncbi:MAG: protease SohB [Proteobacteria bacterium]|nr:MAG: protease SohB [Pseudomonadota bacterium]
MEFLSEYGMFLAKAVTILAVVLAATAGVVALSSRGAPGRAKEHLEVKSLNDKYRETAQALRSAMLPPPLAKRAAKEEKKRLKAEAKQLKHQPETGRHRLFVLDFHGDIRASAVNALREEISAVLAVATAEDEVLVRLESAGGMVHAYGLAASQLQRIRQRNIPLTIAVDKVAASGGYMMACVATRILAAPFAVLGSIGVITQLPNFHRLLKKNNIDFEQITAGDFKRTLTLFGENTEVARQKLRDEVEDVHALFKAYVIENRPQLDIERVATGEHWHGIRALDLKLIDELRTSDDYLMNASGERDLFEVRFVAKKPLLTRLLAAGTQLRQSSTRFWQSDQEPPSLM